MTPSTHFTAGNTPDAPRSDLPGLLESLAADLRGIGYTVDGVAGLLGAAAHSALGRDQLVPALIVTEAAPPRGADDGGARRRRPPLAAGRTAARRHPRRRPARHPHGGPAGTGPRGAVRRRAWIQAKVDLRPYGWDAKPRECPGTPGENTVGSGGAELWVASDLAAHQRPGVLRHDHVLGIGQASTTLVQVTARRHVARALDLGTGCGIQTFHLLHHAEHVTATDISDRALAFTRFNLLLNAGQLHLDPADLEARVSLRLGSLLDPVAGEEFELVVSNPPFVITPRSLGRGRRGPVHLPRRRPAGR